MTSYQIYSQYKDEDPHLLRTVSSETWARELVWTYRDPCHLTQGGDDPDVKVWYEAIEYPVAADWEYG